MSNQRDFKGVWIPKEIWENKDLTLQEKVFLIEIDSLDGEDGCYATNSHFSEFFRVTKGRCSQVISSLEEKKFITIQFIKNEKKQIEKRIIRINKNKMNELRKETKQGIKEIKEGIKKTNDPIKFSKQGYLENAKGSNTVVSNTISNTVNKEKYKKEKAKNELENYITNLEADEDYKELLFKYVEYRKSIKKPIKTIVPIQKIIKDFPNWFILDEAINIAMEKEWQGLEPEWIAKYKQSKTCNNYGNKIAESKDTSQFLVDDDYIEQMNRRYGVKND